jgi:hypothetical protein
MAPKTTLPITLGTPSEATLGVQDHREVQQKTAEAG